MNVESKRIKHSFIVGNKLHGTRRTAGAAAAARNGGKRY
jgi:hypothetical protein